VAGRSRFAQAALVDGAVGIVVAPRGQLRVALTFSFGRGRITEIEVIADPERLGQLDVAVLDG
jgi:RNA polymerase sigma-70 factor (ECF subfamily)